MRELADLLAGLLLFAALVQVIVAATRWDLSAFRDGIPVFEFDDVFPVAVPPALLGKHLETRQIAFKFVSHDLCLFVRRRPNPRTGPFNPPLFAEISMYPPRCHVVARLPRRLIHAYAIGFIGFLILVLRSPSQTNALVTILGCTTTWVASGLGMFALTRHQQRAALEWALVYLRDYVSAAASGGAA